MSNFEIKKLKTTAQIYTKIIISICFLFLVGNAFSQGIKTSQTLFGKPVNSKNINPNNGIIRCATVEYEKYLQEKDPKRLTDAQFEAWLTPLVAKYQTMRTSSQVGSIITIPVVVHVIYNGQAIGVAPNITDAQVQSQITVLNQDYGRIFNTNGFNSNPIGADTQIQFELAKQDPNGNPTNGIDRVNLSQDSWSVTEMDGIVKPKTFWDPTQYMNMWCVKLSDNKLLGYAQFPNASTLTGINSNNGNANTDGVVSRYDVFGSSDYDTGSFLLNQNYNLGRTMTHEVGHFLGLRHIWGDATCGDDFCKDTPTHHDSNYGCPAPIPLSCDTPAVNEMIQNYMDYTDDSCMNIFTIDQSARIKTVMDNSIRRKELKISSRNAAIPLFANDAELKFEINNELPNCGGLTNQTIKKVIIYNRGTTNLTSATLHYTIDGGTNYTNYNWTGNLAINKSVTFPITLYSAVNGTISISVLKANNVTDQRASNNTATSAFAIPATPSNFATTNYVFTLQQDFWGSETTWELKDGSGILVPSNSLNSKTSGGPYTDTYIDATTISAIPALITMNWTLPINQCYTFTIKDAAGDGICCGGTGVGGSGDGYYQLKTADGTIVKSGTNFNSAIESIAFTTNTLGNSAFEISNDIFLYPNPTKVSFKIEIPGTFGLPDNYTVYNSLGAKISVKQVSNQSDLTVNTSALNTGIYFITIEKEGAKKTLQFIKE